MLSSAIHSNFTIAVPDQSSALKSFSIPNEISEMIFAKVDHKVLVNIAMTCRTWNVLANSDAVWISIAKKLGYPVNDKIDISVKLQIKNLFESRAIAEDSFNQEAVEDIFDMCCIFAIL